MGFHSLFHHLIPIAHGTRYPVPQWCSYYVHWQNATELTNSSGKLLLLRPLLLPAHERWRLRAAVVPEMGRSAGWGARHFLCVFRKMITQRPHSFCKIITRNVSQQSHTPHPVVILNVTLRCQMKPHNTSFANSTVWVYFSLGFLDVHGATAHVGAR